MRKVVYSMIVSLDGYVATADGKIGPLEPDEESRFAVTIAAGALSIEAPLDTPYGDRRAMVRDPFHNIWQIAHVTRR